MWPARRSSLRRRTCACWTSRERRRAHFCLLAAGVRHSSSQHGWHERCCTPETGRELCAVGLCCYSACNTVYRSGHCGGGPAPPGPAEGAGKHARAPACGQCPAMVAAGQMAPALWHTRCGMGAVCCRLVLHHAACNRLHWRCRLVLPMMQPVCVCPSERHASAAAQVRYRAARQYAHAARQAAGRPDGAAFQDRAYQVALWCRETLII